MVDLRRDESIWVSITHESNCEHEHQIYFYVKKSIKKNSIGRHGGYIEAIYSVILQISANMRTKWYASF